MPKTQLMVGVLIKSMYKTIMGLGVSMITMGNWVWGNKEIFEFIEGSNIVRPFNYRSSR